MILEEEIQRQEEQAMSHKSMGNLLSMNMSTEKQFRAMENYRLSDYHKQLAEWLRELKKYKEKDVNCTDLCKSCNTKGCIFQSGIVRSHCDFYKAESDKEGEK
jgi:hypothetical protein